MKFTLLFSSLVMVLFYASSKSSVAAIDFEDCGSICEVSNFTIEGCNPDEDCALIIGSNVSVSFDIYNLESQMKTLTNEVSFFWRGVNWPMSVTPDPCSVMSCPTDIRNGTETYRAELSISPTFMPMLGELIWIITGDKNTQVLCIKGTMILTF